MSELSLTQLEIGESGIISKFDSEDDNIRRLKEMGLHSGVAVRVVKYAPFGDPLEIKICGFHLSLRRAIADKIIVFKKDK
jgi:Fe2+ transport system protein FeoA